MKNDDMHCIYSSINFFSFYPSRNEAVGLMAECNKGCGCSTQGFEPVCVNETIYFSPCHAGCEASSMTDGNKVMHKILIVLQTHYRTILIWI